MALLTRASPFSASRGKRAAPILPLTDRPRSSHLANQLHVLHQHNARIIQQGSPCRFHLILLGG
jgi:hypothetical protein